jgi:hypothetical protein
MFWAPELIALPMLLLMFAAVLPKFCPDAGNRRGRSGADRLLAAQKAHVGHEIVVERRLLARSSLMPFIAAPD